jgi:hypothetical protein
MLCCRAEDLESSLLKRPSRTLDLDQNYHQSGSGEVTRSSDACDRLFGGNSLGRRISDRSLRSFVAVTSITRRLTLLRSRNSFICLSISERNARGVGFDVAGAKDSPGLGLVSMTERIHLVHGAFSVESQPTPELGFAPACRLCPILELSQVL